MSRPPTASLSTVLRRHLRAGSLGLALAAALAGCSPATESEATSTLRIEGQSFPRTVFRADGGSFEVPSPPTRIMAANAGVLDALSLLVGPERLAGIASGGVPYSIALSRGTLDLSPEQRDLGHDSESVLDIAPDLLLMNSWQSLEQLQVFDENAINWVSLPDVVAFEDVLSNARLLGRLIGEEAAAERLIDDLTIRRDQLDAPSPRQGLRALAYSNSGGGGYAMGRGTTHDVVLELAGLANVADELDLEWHATLDIETLLDLDPHVLVIAGPTKDELRSSTAVALESDTRLAQLRAVREGRVIEIPPLLFTTNSGYLIEAAEILSAALDSLLAE